MHRFVSSQDLGGLRSEEANQQHVDIQKHYNRNWQFFLCKAFKVTEWGIRAKSSYKLTSEMCKNASDS